MADDKLNKGNPSAPAPEHGVPEQFEDYQKRHDNAKPKDGPNRQKFLDQQKNREPTNAWDAYWQGWKDIFDPNHIPDRGGEFVDSYSEKWNMSSPTGADVGIAPFLPWTKKKSTPEKSEAKQEVVLDEQPVEKKEPKAPAKPPELPIDDNLYSGGVLDEFVITAPAMRDETPFDPRLYRNVFYVENAQYLIDNHGKMNYELMGTDTNNVFDDRRFPYSYVTGQTRIKEFTPFLSEKDDKKTTAEKLKRTEEIAKELLGDGNAWGVQSLMNPYAQISLYNGLAVIKEDGSYKIDKVSLLDKRDRKKFYDINSNVPDDVTSISTPTTTNIIKFGNADGFGRTPYSYQDFVFCKYWNKIPNNRMITLRRYPLPTLDNLNFPGMTEGNRLFAPISTAVTYFGGESKNKLSDLLNFSVSFNWGELTGSVHDVDGSGTGVDNMKQLLGENHASNIYTSMLKTLSFFGTENDSNTMNREAIISVPDPYDNGPYDNKLKGPVNVINKVKQRQTGLEFKNSLKLTFDYVARPIGGINTKAAMLDILANMLVMGYANGLFWGGSYRFMTNPNLYPLKGFNDVAKKLYAGDFEGAASDMIYNVKDSFQGMANIMNMFLDSDIFGAVRNAFTSLLNGDMGQAWTDLKGGMPGELEKNIKGYFSAKLAKKTGIENITGMKALLTGDPVGDWHVTIGNPLNPIAVIGNLIVKNMSVEFGDELGPDDFPLEMTVIVELEHGMGRDKSAIESMFNRGQGRIYTLPDYVNGSSADGETKVDKYTGAGTKPAGEFSAAEVEGLGMYGPFANRQRGKIEHSQTKIVNVDKSILQVPKYTPTDVDNLYTEFESIKNSDLSRYFDYHDKQNAWLGEKTVN